MAEKYFKITNAEEKHHGFQYVDGLNVLKEPFQEEGSCVPGGLYFTNAMHILDFLSFGIYLREITLPTSDPDFKMIQDPGENKWRANKIILGEKRNLADRSTWEYLFSLGVRYVFFDSLKWAAENGSLDVIKMFIEKGDTDAILLAYGNYLLRKASQNNHIKIVEYLVDAGIDLKNGDAISIASEYGHLEIVKFLVENGADLKIRDKDPIRWACYNSHIEVVKFLIENGSDIGVAIHWASKKNHTDTGERIDWLSVYKQDEVINFLAEYKKPKKIYPIKN